MPQELREAPPFPSIAGHVWGWFQELQEGRSGNGFGPNPLSFAEIAAWASLTGRRPQPWEVRALKKIDLAYLETTVKPPEKKNGS